MLYFFFNKKIEYAYNLWDKHRFEFLFSLSNDGLIIACLFFSPKFVELVSDGSHTYFFVFFCANSVHLLLKRGQNRAEHSVGLILFVEAEYFVEVCIFGHFCPDKHKDLFF